MQITPTATNPATALDLLFHKTSQSTSSDSFLQQLESAIETGAETSPIAQEFDAAASSAAVPAQPATTSDVTPADSTPSNTQTSTADTSEMSPTDAYWAEQPAAVQALRDAPEDQKGALAEQLASEGYAIDVPIMVWGWDPLATMIERQSAGYTWVPSALEPSVDIAPGVSMPGTQSYNPNNPPAGSIAVSTAFANGTDIAADPVAEEWLNGESSATNSTVSS